MGNEYILKFSKLGIVLLAKTFLKTELLCLHLKLQLLLHTNMSPHLRLQLL